MSDDLVSWSVRHDPENFRVEVPNCSDHDEDCHDIEDKVHCYLYDPIRGMCPYLRSNAGKAEQ